MNPFKIACGVVHRWKTLHQYAAAAPTVRSMHRWLVLGALSCRLFGGQGRAHPLNQPRDFLVPIGKNANQEVIVDISSFTELDVLREILVDRIYPLDQIGFTPKMILDCGANVGYFASLARVKFPKAQLVCWEPDSSNFSRLISQPLLSGEGVNCFHAAVSDSDGEAMLSGDGVGCMLVRSPKEEARPVKTINFPRWLEDNGLFPLLIKIDVEGHEQQILRAMQGKWKRPCVMFLETHAENGDDQGMLQDLAADAFNVDILRTHHIANDPRLFKEYLCTLQ